MRDATEMFSCFCQMIVWVLFMGMLYKSCESSRNNDKEVKIEFIKNGYVLKDGDWTKDGQNE